ncbi:MAG: hypothetical protein QGG40_11255, partial [Myxococcota bacterium]|nr:hypothetical protein [Myxococcota bacterium]
MTVLWFLLGIVACTSPEMEMARDAIETWERGRQSLDAGDTTAAAESFAMAAGLDPSSPLLPAWEAR